MFGKDPPRSITIDRIDSTWKRPPLKPVQWMVEGETVSVADIAKRLDISENVAHHRFSRARKLAGPVTWDKLRGKR